MVYLHPVFLVAFVFMVLISFVEVNTRKKSWVAMFLLAIYLIVISGLRKYVGADYLVYQEMYKTYFPLFVEYKELVPKMFLQESKIEIEWLYVVLNKVVYNLTLGGPFYILTFIVSAFVIGVKFSSFYKNSAAPALAALIYFVPTFFISDSGHMRQGISITLALYSFKFIKERKLLPYLFVIYLALSFHKSVIVFLPAYWLATVDLNSKKILILVAVCMVLSPLKIYSGFNFMLDALSVQDISAGYQGYVSYETEEEGGRLKLFDLLSLIYISLIVLYDKETCAKIPYYEYMRNIGVMGVCIYFIMRGNPVFSTRLVASFMIYMALVVSNVIYSIQSSGSRKVIHFVYAVFLVFYIFVFAKFQGNSTYFTIDRYKNFLWSD